MAEDRPPRPPRATPPIETPGPSVRPPVFPASDTERAEWAEATKPDHDSLEWTGKLRETDELVAEEESAAMAEARMIGGPIHHEGPRPELDPVYEAGGGEQEGWEQSEADLVENATHGDGHGDPYRDMLSPELEADRSSAEYGEPDEEDIDDRW